MSPAMKNESTPEPVEQPPPYEEGSSEPIYALPRLNLNQQAGPAANTTVTTDECIAHLKFLSVLADLREYISRQDGLFGIYDNQAERVGPEKVNEAGARIREKRWAVYVARAVDRFTVWWERAVPKLGARPTLSKIRMDSYSPLEMGITPLVWERRKIPPLDVLMVWHSFTLNPRSYLEDCFCQARMNCWLAGFPWDVIDSCIDIRDFTYFVPEETMNYFAVKTGLNWNNLNDPNTKTLRCPKNGCTSTVPWTAGGMSPDCTFEDSYGYADKSFIATCPHSYCGFEFTHETLKISKFWKDLVNLTQNEIPMPGTLLSVKGTFHTTYRVAELFPNALLIHLKDDLRGQISPGLMQIKRVEHLRDWIDKQVSRRFVLYEANMEAKKHHAGLYRDRDSRIAIRRMMSRYWNNSSPFALDLVGAVIRQGTFVQKMDDLDWLHSPTVDQTMKRLIEKYGVFFNIMAFNPDKMAVPTLDVDLAWHTHQLSPARYYEFSTKRTGDTFIDHDDKVEETKLSDGFEWTTRQYHRLTDGGIYSQCLCWYCEAVRAPSLLERLSISKADNRARESLHDNENVSSDPNRNPHISAHNAVRAEGVTHNSYHSLVKIKNLQAAYQRARRRADKQRQKSEKSKGGEKDSKNRDNRNSNTADAYPAAYPFIWGYPMFVPYAAPYMCDPSVSSGSYANNPACMNVGAGAVGSCVSGTCGGTVASGGCAGLGVGACGGSGGCSGGAGGCGGGGGVGGGGGCGGGGGGGGGGC